MPEVRIVDTVVAVWGEDWGGGGGRARNGMSDGRERKRDSDSD